MANPLNRPSLHQHSPTTAQPALESATLTKTRLDQASSTPQLNNSCGTHIKRRPWRLRASYSSLGSARQRDSGVSISTTLRYASAFIHVATTKVDVSIHPPTPVDHYFAAKVPGAMSKSSQLELSNHPHQPHNTADPTTNLHRSHPRRNGRGRMIKRDDDQTGR